MKTVILVCLSVFLLSACVPSTDLVSGSFTKKMKEGPEDGDFVELKDGRTLSGDRVKLREGFFAKDVMIVDGNRYPLKDIKGYRKAGHYYYNWDGDFIQRLVAGKLSVYVYEYQQSYQDISSRQTHYDTYARYFFKRENNDTLFTMKNLEDIQKAVSGCPQALALADISAKQLKRALRRNGRYLNEVFITYNRECK